MKQCRFNSSTVHLELPVLSDGFHVLFYIQGHRFGFPVISNGFPVLLSNLAV